MAVYWIWLSTRQGIGEQLKLRLLERWQDPQKLYQATEGEYRSISGMNGRALEALGDKSLECAQKILTECKQKQIQFVNIFDEQYPRRLKDIHDPPILLYYRGTLPPQSNRLVIGAVGTRSCSREGIETARQFGYQLSRGGALIASGMAEGIDAAVMTGVLTAGGNPMVFLAGGVDMVYPAANKGLYEKILEHGCVLSEQPPGTRPAKWLFPRRNRLISGAASGVLVVEAPEKSGALITAQHALEQGRDLFTVPSSVHCISGKGTNGLLRKGAIAVQEGWEVIEYYLPAYGSSISCHKSVCDPEQLEDLAQLLTAELPRQVKKPMPDPGKTKKKIDKSPAPPYSDVENRPLMLSDRERAIVDQLLQGLCQADDVIAGSGLPYAQAVSVMTMLEIRGVIKRHPGNLIGLQKM